MSSSLNTITIKPNKGWEPLNLSELWEYRELIYFFIWRDVKVRYKQTALGITWAVIQPFFTMIIFSIFFGFFAKMKSDGIAYPIFSYSGLVAWTFFATAVNHSSESILSYSHLIRKIYFPRLIIPIAAVISGVVNFACTLVVLFIMMFCFGIYPSLAIFFLPLFCILIIIAALGVGLWLTALNSIYRDIRNTIPFILQAWLFATPIVYPSSILHEPLKTLYGLNPMAGVVEGFRWALLGTPPPGNIIWVSAFFSVLLLISGAYFFRRMEKVFADIL